jgi:hypothetical protein
VGQSSGASTGAAKRAKAAQLSLFAPVTAPQAPDRKQLRGPAVALADALSRELGLPVHLTLTDNRTSLLSFTCGPEELRLRVHHLFVHAPPPVVQALADYAGRGELKARAALEAFARAHRRLVRPERGPGAPTLRTRGRCFDLGALFRTLNARHFGNQVSAKVGWARRAPKRRRKSIQLATYDARAAELRVHPALDAPDVPAFVVEYFVFHALLHAHTGAPPGVHPPEFLAQEQRFALREAALRWREEHLPLLLRR